MHIAFHIVLEIGSLNLNVNALGYKTLCTKSKRGRALFQLLLLAKMALPPLIFGVNCL
jgi:ABC-type spermidine/putrescine transport system permease subunit II